MLVIQIFTTVKTLTQYFADSLLTLLLSDSQRLPVMHQTDEGSRANL